MKQLDQYPLWTAMVTPFDEKGDVDLESLEILLKKQQDTSNGVLILGSTGEALALSLAEKQQIIQFVSKLKLSVPIMVGVSGFRLQEQLDWIEFCQQYKNISAFLLVTPCYSKPGLKGQIKWFHSLLDKAQRPCMLYNTPSRSGVQLYPQVLAILQDHKNLWALKEASGNLDDFYEYRLLAPKVSFYSGNDDLMPYYALMGCKGLVSVVSNVWPEATELYVRKSLIGHGSELFPIWKKACQAIFQVTNPIPVKVLLYKKKWIKSPLLRAPLTYEDLQDIKQLLNMNQAIDDWYEQHK